MFSLFFDIDCKIISPISEFQIHKSRTNISVSSATTITSYFSQEISNTAATICVSASPSHLITVCPSSLKCLAKSLISGCSLFELLKNSSRKCRTFTFSLTKTSAHGGLYASCLVRDPWFFLINIHQILFNRSYILRVPICNIRLLLPETLIQRNILDVAKLQHQ